MGNKDGEGHSLSTQLLATSIAPTTPATTTILLDLLDPASRRRSGCWDADTRCCLLVPASFSASISSPPTVKSLGYLPVLAAFPFSFAFSGTGS
jgi:hypothetical protein